MEELRFYLNLTGNRQYNNNKIESLEIYMGTDLNGHRTFNAREIPGLRQLTEYPIFIGNWKVEFAPKNTKSNIKKRNPIDQRSKDQRPTHVFRCISVDWLYHGIIFPHDTFLGWAVLQFKSHTHEELTFNQQQQTKTWKHFCLALLFCLEIAKNCVNNFMIPNNRLPDYERIQVWGRVLKIMLIYQRGCSCCYCY